MKKVFTCILVVLSIAAKANDVIVTSVSLTGQSTAGPLNTHYTQVQFTIDWKNSWRTSTNESNWDGCWIFVKYRKQSTSVWQHATLNVTGQVEPAGSTVKPSADGKGAWIYRNADGIGNVNFAGAQLRWNYGADGVLDNENVEIKVFAVEMVYVPQGTFNLGNASAEAFKFRDGAVNTWFPITSEGAITCGTGAGQLFATGNFTASGTIATAFPKGFAAFWCMKYEFSRQQYVDFLNTLDQTNANSRNSIGATGSVPNMVVTSPTTAATANFTAVSVMAWLDWAAMRPMTEFEYEKACRGANNLPSPLECAWGNTTILNISTPTGPGTSTETWATGNVNFSGSIMRCGALATATSTRVTSGATFYGIMEMSGNTNELAVIANGTGKNYTGLHGDGILSALAEANTANWPANAPVGTDFIFKGGSYNEGATNLQVSDRSSAGAFNTSNYTNLGGRGVRTGE